MSDYASRLLVALDRTDRFRDDPEGLLRALLPHSSEFRPLSESLRRGTVLWSVAGLLDGIAEDPRQLAKMLPTPHIEPSAAMALRHEAVTTGSIVFRSWVSLVFMRFDTLLDILRSLPRENDHLNAFVDLITSDEVRHVRNAISHGTFEAEFQRFLWRDRHRSGEFSYDLLRRLNMAVFTFWLNVDAVAIAPPNATLP